MGRFIGKVKISEELLLDWLGLQGGTIKGAEFDWAHNAVLIGLEHPKMPLVREGEVLQIVGSECFTSVAGK